MLANTAQILFYFFFSRSFSGISPFSKPDHVGVGFTCVVNREQKSEIKKILLEFSTHRQKVTSRSVPHGVPIPQ